MSPSGVTTDLSLPRPAAPSLPVQSGGPGPAPRPRPPKVWLVGENNPYSQDPRFDLYFEPQRSAGGRLCRVILGMDEREYLRAFERRNLLRQPTWSIPRRSPLRTGAGPRDRLGLVVGRCSRPARAQGVRRLGGGWGAARSQNSGWDGRWTPFTTLWCQEMHYALLPHPSGRCREWNARGSVERARAAVLEVAPHLKGKLGVMEDGT